MEIGSHASWPFEEVEIREIEDVGEGRQRNQVGLFADLPPPSPGSSQAEYPQQADLASIVEEGLGQPVQMELSLQSCSLTGRVGTQMAEEVQIAKPLLDRKIKSLNFLAFVLSTGTGKLCNLLEKEFNKKIKEECEKWLQQYTCVLKKLLSLHRELLPFLAQEEFEDYQANLTQLTKKLQHFETGLHDKCERLSTDSGSVLSFPPEKLEFLVRCLSETLSLLQAHEAFTSFLSESLTLSCSPSTVNAPLQSTLSTLNEVVLGQIKLFHTLIGPISIEPLSFLAFVLCTETCTLRNLLGKEEREDLMDAVYKPYKVKNLHFSPVV